MADAEDNGVEYNQEFLRNLIKNIMQHKSHLFYLLFAIPLVCIVIACNNNKEASQQKTIAAKQTDSAISFNPVVYFEIPVTDMSRAVQFYSAVFHFQFEKDTIDSNEMALFPFTDGATGISGALAKGEVYKPTKDGTILYFRTENIDETLKRAQQQGAKILYPKTSNGDLGFVAEFEDSEGNRIALHMAAK